MNFEEFVKSRFINHWIKEPGINIYVRKPNRYRLYYQLANMNAAKLGNGSLTNFLDKYEPDFKFEIENILNYRLILYLEKRGYVDKNELLIPSSMEIQPCMVKP